MHSVPVLVGTVLAAGSLLTTSNLLVNGNFEMYATTRCSAQSNTCALDVAIMPWKNTGTAPIMLDKSKDKANDGSWALDLASTQGYFSGNTGTLAVTQVLLR